MSKFNLYNSNSTDESANFSAPNPKNILTTEPRAKRTCWSVWTPHFQRLLTMDEILLKIGYLQKGKIHQTCLWPF
jgi:hypothetical protein